MSSRSLDDLCPEMKAKALQLEQLCKEHGIDLLIYCTYRSNEEQQHLYNQGRTTHGPIVTNAKPGQSKHNTTKDGKPYAEAFDCCPLRHGKAVWGTAHPEDAHLWEKLGALGESIGLEWAGHWKSFVEYPHFQLKGESK